MRFVKLLEFRWVPGMLSYCTKRNACNCVKVHRNYYRYHAQHDQAILAMLIDFESFNFFVPVDLYFCIHSLNHTVWTPSIFSNGGMVQDGVSWLTCHHVWQLMCEVGKGWIVPEPVRFMGISGYFPNAIPPPNEYGLSKALLRDDGGLHNPLIMPYVGLVKFACVLVECWSQKGLNKTLIFFCVCVGALNLW